jgi:hypothetical protein
MPYQHATQIRHATRHAMGQKTDVTVFNALHKHTYKGGMGDLDYSSGEEYHWKQGLINSVLTQDEGEDTRLWRGSELSISWHWCSKPGTYYLEIESVFGSDKLPPLP